MLVDSGDTITAVTLSSNIDCITHTFAAFARTSAASAAPDI